MIQRSDGSKLTIRETLILFGEHSSYFSHGIVIIVEVCFHDFRPYFDSASPIYFLYTNALRRGILYYTACFASLTDIGGIEEGPIKARIVLPCQANPGIRTRSSSEEALKQFLFVTLTSRVQATYDSRRRASRQRLRPKTEYWIGALITES